MKFWITIELEKLTGFEHLKYKYNPDSLEIKNYFFHIEGFNNKMMRRKKHRYIRRTALEFNQVGILNFQGILQIFNFGDFSKNFWHFNEAEIDRLMVSIELGLYIWYQTIFTLNVPLNLIFLLRFIYSVNFILSILFLSPAFYLLSIFFL